MTRRLRIAIGVVPAALVAALAFAQPASAVVYCVPNNTLDASCVTPSPTVQGALSAAQASTATADTVLIGTGTFNEADMSYASTVPANTVDVIGRGTGSTELTYPSTAGMAEGLNFGAPAGSTLSDLKITMPTNDVTTDFGLDLEADAKAQRVLVSGPTTSNAQGVNISGGAVLDDSTVDLAFASPGNAAVTGSTGIVSDTLLKANVGRSYSGSGGTAIVDRSRIEADLGATADSGTIVVRNSIIVLNNVAGAVGVQAANFNNSFSLITANVTNTTIVGGGVGSVGVQSEGNSTNAGEDSVANVNSTVISGPAIPLKAFADNGESATINSEYSNYNAAANLVDSDIDNTGATGTAAINQSNQTNLSPAFINPGTGDYHLMTNSPLIDIGDPAVPPMFIKDIDGEDRAQDGTGPGCPSARDIGADEVPGTAIIDCIPPETQIDSGPSGPTNDSTPTFTFSSEAGASFQCSIDGELFAACSDPGSHTPMTPLGEGGHTFEVKAKDNSPQQNVDPTPAMQAFSVDTIPPETTITGGPGLTNNPQPSFSFGSDAGATFECRVDAEPFVACSGPGATHVPAALPDGPHQFEVRATDTASNLDTSPATRSFTVDTSAPGTSVSGKTKVKTRKKRARISFSFGSEAGAALECSLDRAAFAPCASPFSAKVKKGSHTFQVRATDAAGNKAQSPASFTTKVKRKRAKPR